MEIIKTVIFDKCRDFAKIPCFAVFFCQNAMFLRFYKNISFLISTSCSILCNFNTKIFTFAPANKVSDILVLKSGVAAVPQAL